MTNVDGYGHDIVPIDTVEGDQESEDKKSLELVQDLFNDPNGDESMITLRQKLRRDREVTGNGYIEIIRNLNDEPTLMFWMDAKKTRLCPLDKKPTAIKISVTRGGNRIEISSEKRFRRFAMITQSMGMTRSGTSPQLRYFKEFGDPRRMNALTGKYLNEDEFTKRASRSAEKSILKRLK